MKFAEPYDPTEFRCVAIHAAGQAVAAFVLRLGPAPVNVRPQTLRNGSIRWDLALTAFSNAELASKGEIARISHLIRWFSGPIAEQKLDWRVRDHDVSDAQLEHRRWIAAIATFAAASADERRWDKSRWRSVLESAYASAAHLVEDRWPAIKKVAESLEKNHELSADEVAAIVNTLPFRSASIWSGRSSS